MDIRNTLSLAGGLLVLGAAGYYWGGFGQEQHLTADADTRHLPDYEIVGIHGLQTNQLGQVERTITASQLVHFPDPDRSVIDHPSVQLYRDGSAAWHISAQEATVTNHNNQLDLSGQVAGRSLQGLALNLSTDRLSADQQEQTLITDSPVLVRSPQGQISSLGLSANLKDGTLTFPAQVRGTYVLPPR